VGLPGQADTVPNENRRTYAQLTDEEKDAISHRGQAMRCMERKLADFLTERSESDTVDKAE
jgi:XTP/dITP diphosphohydrolase